MADKRNLIPKKPSIKLRGTPVPMPKPGKRTYPKGIKPAPMPKRVPNLSLPLDQRAKPKVMPSGPKKKTLRGPAAIKEIQRQVSPKGVKKTESGAKKGLDKKYPGLYKKSK